MEETKGRNPDSGPRETDDRTDRRHERDPRSWPEKRENEDSGLRINDPGQIRQRIGNETESRFWAHVRRATNLDWRRSESSPYPLRPSVEDCQHYLGCGWCTFGSTCRFNHPPTHHAQVRRERISLPNCKMRPTVQFNEGIGTGESVKNAYLQEQRRRDIERPRSEARLRLEQMRPTVEFNEADRTTELLRELGVKFTEEAELRATPK